MMGFEESKEVRTWGMLAHLSSLAGFVIPFGNIFGPLIVWLVKGKESSFVDEHGKEALNFQISMTIYMVFAGLSLLILIGIIILPLLVLADLIYTVIAAVAANDGRSYRYPMTIRFIS
jgi:uncharacterized protein